MPGGLPKRTSRALLDIEDATVVPIIRNPVGPEDSDAVFYFPGCGSERLFSQVGLATQAMLWHIGAQTVLPPGYLCCGYPQTAAGEADRGQRIVTDNRVLFHRVANTLNYLDIKTVIVSCGTCLDQLEKYEFGEIFPGCRLLDIHEYLLEKGVRLEGIGGVRYMYHDPCHTPMKVHKPLHVVSALMGTNVPLNDRCCGESGTLATTRPDISTQVRFRKEHEMRGGAFAHFFFLAITHLRGDIRSRDGERARLAAAAIIEWNGHAHELIDDFQRLLGFYRRMTGIVIHVAHAADAFELHAFLEQILVNIEQPAARKNFGKFIFL